jgi:hypothetical protein
VESVESAA